MHRLPMARRLDGAHTEEKHAAVAEVVRRFQDPKLLAVAQVDEQ